MNYLKPFLKIKNKRILIWTPRIIMILYIGFISIFALDVFTEKNWLVPLLMHLIPSFILILTTSTAWKYPKIGGIFLLLLSIFAIFFFHSFILSMPILISSFLFLINEYL